MKIQIALHVHLIFLRFSTYFPQDLQTVQIVVLGLILLHPPHVHQFVVMVLLLVMRLVIQELVLDVTVNVLDQIKDTIALEETEHHQQYVS